MPIIPGLNQGQVLNAGSPVPVASPEEARLASNAITQAGQGLFVLGDALDSASKREKANTDRLAAESALQQFRMRTLEEQAKSFAAAPLKDDGTGYGQVKDFTSRMQQTINELANQLPADDTRRQFMNMAYDNINDAGKEVFAKELVKRAKQNEVVQGQVISTIGQRVSADPTQLDTALLEVEHSIRSNPNYVGATMEEAISVAKKQTVLEAINGRKNSGDYNNANKLLNQFGAGIFDAKEKNQLAEDISSTAYRAYTRDLADVQLKEKNIEKQQKDIQKKSMSYFYSALSTAGVNEEKRQTIFRDMDLAVVKGNMDTEQAKALKGSKVFSDPVDDYYDMGIIKDVYKTGNVDAAIEKVSKDAGISVSPRRADDMINKLRNIKERQDNDPVFKNNFSAATRKIKQQGDPSMMSMMDDFAKREHSTKVAQAEEEFIREAYKNPKQDLQALSNSIIERYLGSRTQFIRGQENYMLWNDPTKIKEEQAKIYQQGLVLEKKGLLTKEKEDDIKNNMRVYEQRFQQLILDKEMNQSTGAATTPTSGAARGK